MQTKAANNLNLIMLTGSFNRNHPHEDFIVDWAEALAGRVHSLTVIVPSKPMSQPKSSNLKIKYLNQPNKLGKLLQLLSIIHSENQKATISSGLNLISTKLLLNNSLIVQHPNTTLS